jgi:hypothetical protein
MKRNHGYDMQRAEKSFFDACDGTHILHLVEVFEHDGIDVTRTVGDVDHQLAAGELWIVDEDGHDEITAAGWLFEGRETVGFDRAELEEMGDQS